MGDSKGRRETRRVNERSPFGPFGRLLGCLTVLLALTIVGFLLIVATLAWINRTRELGDAEGWAARPLAAIGGVPSARLVHAQAFQVSDPANYLVFFEIPPLADGQVATADEIERRLRSTGHAATRVASHPASYERRETTLDRISQHLIKPPEWWPSDRTTKVITFAYASPAYVELIVLPDGRVFGSEFTPD